MLIPWAVENFNNGSFRSHQIDESQRSTNICAIKIAPKQLGAKS